MFTQIMKTVNMVLPELKDTDVEIAESLQDFRDITVQLNYLRLEQDGVVNGLMHSLLFASLWVIRLDLSLTGLTMFGLRYTSKSGNAGCIAMHASLFLTSL